MSEQDERESEGAEVRREDQVPVAEREEERRRPQVFSELGTGITTREVVIPPVEEGEGSPVVAESAAAPAEVEGVTLSGEQRLLILDAWSRSEMTAGEFGKIAGISPHTLYATGGGLTCKLQARTLDSSGGRSQALRRAE